MRVAVGVTVAAAVGVNVDVEVAVGVADGVTNVGPQNPLFKRKLLLPACGGPAIA